MTAETSPRVVIASDKFKGTLSAVQVAQALAAGIRGRRPGAVVVTAPVADGGDGTLDAAEAMGFRRVPVFVSGPTGRPVATDFVRDGDRAVIELADACGLVRLPGGEPAPMTATSHGVGELIATALDRGCRELVLGIGGSASTDGGAGLLRALGARLLDASGEQVADGGAALAQVQRLDLSGLRSLDGVEITVACDVDNPLLGPTGAAAVYGPQKGADAAQVIRLDEALAHWADVVAEATGADLRETPGAGAAGGVGFAALAVLGARLAPGIELLLDLVGFDDLVVGADLVITGEGALDEQTLHGKAPAGVAAAAARAGVPVVAVCGVNRLSTQRLAEADIEAVYALTDVEPDVDRCLADPAPLLTLLGERIGEERLASPVAASGRTS